MSPGGHSTPSGACTIQHRPQAALRDNQLPPAANVDLQMLDIENKCFVGFFFGQKARN